MTVDEKVGQLLIAAVTSTYIGSDTDEFDALAAKVGDLHVGGFLVFGGRGPRPACCSTRLQHVDTRPAARSGLDPEPTPGASAFRC